MRTGAFRQACRGEHAEASQHHAIRLRFGHRLGQDQGVGIVVGIGTLPGVSGQVARAGDFERRGRGPLEPEFRFPAGRDAADQIKGEAGAGRIHRTHGKGRGHGARAVGPAEPVFQPTGASSGWVLGRLSPPCPVFAGPPTELPGIGNFALVCNWPKKQILN